MKKHEIATLLTSISVVNPEIGDVTERLIDAWHLLLADEDANDVLAAYNAWASQTSSRFAPKPQELKSRARIERHPLLGLSAAEHHAKNTVFWKEAVFKDGRLSRFAQYNPYANPDAMTSDKDIKFIEKDIERKLGDSITRMIGAPVAQVDKYLADLDSRYLHGRRKVGMLDADASNKVLTKIEEKAHGRGALER